MTSNMTPELLMLTLSVVLWAAAAYRLPMVAGSLFGMAFGAGYFPILLLIS